MQGQPVAIPMDAAKSFASQASLHERVDGHSAQRGPPMDYRPLPHRGAPLHSDPGLQSKAD